MGLREDFMEKVIFLTMSVPEPEDSFPVLTWILGYLWSLPRGVSPRLDWGHARALSSRSVGAVLRFPLQGTREPGNNGPSKSLPINNSSNVNDGILQSKICCYWMNFSFK